MKKSLASACYLLLIFMVTISVFSACNSSVASNNPNPSSNHPESSTPLSFQHVEINPDNAITFKNLKIYPIYSKSGGGAGDSYIPLNEAIQSEKLEISEKSLSDRGGDEVNKLFIENKSTDTIFLMAGEVVKGGKQDRTLGQDVVLEPGSGKKDVEVFCVEQHRWSPKAENVEANKPREEMKFKKSAPIVKNTVRKKAVLDKEQGKVWDEVAVTVTKANAVTESGSYTAIEDNKDYQKIEKEYLAYFTKALQADKKIIGFLAVTGNKIIGCDMFSSPVLFQKTLSSVLPSYINEAIHDGGPITIDPKVVSTYLENMFGNDNKQKEFLSKQGNVFKYKQETIHVNTY